MTAVPDPGLDVSAPHGGVFWGEPPARDAVLVRGADAVRFIDGFQTAAVARLGPDRGTESFFTDVRGHVLVMANILRPTHVPMPAGPQMDGGEAAARMASDAGAVLWLDLPAGTAAGLLEHLERYHIREDVGFVDVSPRGPTGLGTRRGLFVGGTGAATWLAEGGGAAFQGRPPDDPLGVATGRLGGVPVSIVRSDRHGRGFDLFAADVPAVRDWLVAAGVPRASDDLLEELRILARHPGPRDIPPKTLPQELDRPAAISFTKGCYLGQETVARLDALGHVNRRLAVVAVDGGPPEPPAAVLDAAGAQVGTITSACRSTRPNTTEGREPRRESGLGLAIVHLRAVAAGAALSVEGRAARVVEPVSRPPADVGPC